MLTMDEYLAIRRLIESERESEGAIEEAKPKKRKVNKKANRAMSRALAEANARLRTKPKKGSKNKYGPLRKGKTQADVMSLAQRLRRKM